MPSLFPSLPSMLANIPSDWRGTTYPNDALKERRGFAEGINALLSSKSKSNPEFTAEDMVSIGTSEDYFRVSSNFTTLCEMALAEKNEVPVEQVFTFGSVNMGILAVAMATKKRVNLYCDGAASPFDDRGMAVLQKMNVDLVVHQSKPVAKVTDGSINLISVSEDDAIDFTGVMEANAAGILCKHVLVITSPSVIPPADILVIRKRLSTPITNPMAEVSFVVETRPSESPKTNLVN